jgi:PleD family two-component response regulator
VVLAGIARRIKRRMRVTDHLARWGGEEFLLICPETDTQGAMVIAERMRNTICRKPFTQAGTVTASFGIGSYSGEGSVGVLVQRADQYLYAAKQRGRNCVISHLNAHQPTGSIAKGEMVDTTGLDVTSRLTKMLSTLAAPIRRVRRR